MKQGITIKRIILTILTVVTFWLVSVSLIESWNEPQIQSTLELYQTNLLLHANEWQGNNIQGVDINSAKEKLLGKDIIETALKQYQEASNEGESLLQKLFKQEETALNKEQHIKLRLKQQKSLDIIDLRLGVLRLKNNEKQKAVEAWKNILVGEENKITKPFKETAISLQNLVKNPPVVAETETLINQNLDGWFRYQALSQLYSVQNDTTKLANLKLNEQKIAEESIIKLAIIGLIPGLGILGGSVLLISLLVQRLLKGKEAILSTAAVGNWQAPWDWEVIWLVMVGGFLFIGQVAVPVLIRLLALVLKIDPSSFDPRSQAFYILFTYFLLAGGGILAIYLSVKPFIPLPKNWFQFKFEPKAFLWGFGGYLVALPLVVLVSLINQKIWQGQGGSNPILPIALEGKDSIALLIFFVTAAILAPLFEEVMFRGFLLPSLNRYLPVWGAIIVSAFIFAIAHLNVSEVLPLMTLGIILGFVYIRSGNLLSSIILHGLWNSGTLLSLYVLGSGKG